MNWMILPCRLLLVGAIMICTISGCQSGKKGAAVTERADSAAAGLPADLAAADLLDKYAVVRLSTDLSVLSENERKLIPLLIEAAEHMDNAFWMQAYGEKEVLMRAIRDRDLRRFAEINYGPWDRLADNRPFLPGVGPKSPGANFYPHDMTKDEFERRTAESPGLAEQLRSPYTMVRRDEAGHLKPIPYHVFFMKDVLPAQELLREAAMLSPQESLRTYLLARATALTSDQYQASDRAWLDMKDNTVDIVIGPIETYEDQIFGYKAAYEAFVLVKDREWSDRLTRYAAMLPDLQRGLPVENKYKQESPGSDSDLNAYDVIYYAGDCNAGAKTIAINLPNDEQVQLEKGTRRLQLKNAMRAKFDKILVPIADLLIAEDQRRHITFNAFFENTMFHEVAHGLGIKNTINGRGTVREALKDQHSALEEGKADILGLYMVSRLYEQGELSSGELMDNYVTFLAGIFRSVRFGASSAHGRANMVRFNFFEQEGAFSRDEATGTYRVKFEAMKQAMEKLGGKILRLQGEGDYAGVQKLMTDYGDMPAQLQSDLARVNAAGIPVDIIFEQGMSVLRG